MSDEFFEQATPIWPAGRGKVWNQMVGFHAGWVRSEGPGDVTLRVTAADCYRVWCNGRYAGYGPARTAHGHARVDEWSLNHFLAPGENHLAIDVLSHNVDSYAFAMTPPFLQAELRTASEQTLLATGKDFFAYLLPERVQKVERFSKQRPFTEVYRLTAHCHDWRVGEGDRPSVPCEAVPPLTLLPRHVERPTLNCVYPRSRLAVGEVVAHEPARPPASLAGRRAVARGVVMGYPDEELEVCVSDELNNLDFVDHSPPPSEPGAGRRVQSRGHVLFDFGFVQGGFVGAKLCCASATRVFLVFEEMRDRPTDARFCLGVGAVMLDLQPGTHEIESMDPYTFRFLRVVAMDATVEVEQVWVRDYAHPASDTSKRPDDEALAMIYDAARQTFRTNSLDLFTDCMSRERGGYPCDAWFTAKAERAFTGESRVERNFLENYFLVSEFSSVPAGMVPHCYPSDRVGKGQYIPNWALWLVLQLCDHCLRTADESLKRLARPRVEALFAFLEPYVNEFGLLEDLPGWVFVEWSKANDFVTAVNYPTNMLYAACLTQAGQLYVEPAWKKRAEQVRASVRELSWDGRSFADQSVRVDGKLQRSEGRSETCQYHAFYFDVADRETHGALWRRLLEMHEETSSAAFYPANMLYGMMLRYELMTQYGEHERLLAELRDTFLPQARMTGTLWEHSEPRSSLNHGFASCVLEYMWAALEATDP